MELSGDLASYAGGDLCSLRGEIAARLRGAGSFADAAQRFAGALYETFPRSVPLARVYATLPYSALAAGDREFVNRTSTPAQRQARRPSTLVLVLLGTRGARAAWNDRESSAEHRAIALGDAIAVEGIPMLGRLLAELGLDLRWLELGEAVLARRLVGGFNGVFYVDDAATACDPQGRAVIPAQDFVTEHGIRTVFGMGGCYLLGTLAAAIVFTRERLSRAQAEWLASVVSVFKIATEPLVADRRLYG
jgi:hypothetical protein